MTDKRVDVSHLALAAAGAALTVVLAGCGGGTDNAGGTSTPPSSSAAESSSQEPSSPPSEGESGDPSATESEQPAPPPENSGLCNSGNLKVALGQGDAAAGTQYRPLQFTNTGDAPCEIQGYPGVSYVAGEDGHQVGASAFREGTKGDAIALKPGETAYAEIGFTQVLNYDPEQCKPTDVRGLRVYPPQETESVFVEMAGEGCAGEGIPGNQLTVQTIQPGSGNAP
ncbi:DUF4232 domain-containing protein [Prauserella cavernicola]|uniref:DUF4232 domain-containing protein n=1 Tax=Prauserella cavernicola TaxID=2800127 RepID=A0A934QS87_9PSEU|nr:DUF4232 domain-containing protein [Prauserella cavernicola]MBK1784394.1 DUF4232 domain-containing protein [Prauserella cavernicola]